MRTGPESFAVACYGSRPEEREIVRGSAQPTLRGIAPLCGCVLPNGFAHSLDLIRNIAMLAQPLLDSLRRCVGQISGPGSFRSLYNLAGGFGPFGGAATQTHEHQRKSEADGCSWPLQLVYLYSLM